MEKLSKVEKVINKQIKLEDIDVYLSKINAMLKIKLDCLPFIDYNGDGEVGLECCTNNNYLKPVPFASIIKILNDLNKTYANLKSIDDTFWANSTIPMLDTYCYNYFAQENKISMHLEDDIILVNHGDNNQNKYDINGSLILND